MAALYRIHCVTPSDRFNHHQRLRRLGGVNPDGARWRIGEAEAIAGIEAGRWRFVVAYRGRDWEVEVATSKYGTKYLKTAADTLHPDSLLALPHCG